MSKKINDICPMPFHQLYIHSSGEVYPCGFLQGRISFGNITKNSLDDIWHSDKTNQFRKDHIAGKNTYCSSCQNKYNCHVLHENIWDRASSNFDPKLKRLDIMIDSFCNLKCGMCTNRSEVNGGFLNDFFWDELEKNVLPQIEEIELIGGEPLISKDSYRLMKLVNKVNPTIRWVITTNGQLEFNKTLIHHLDLINIYSFSVSVDSLDKERFAQIRPGGKLERSINFIDKLKEYKTSNNLSFFINCNFLIQKDNYLDLLSLIEFSNKREINCYPILLREPEQFSIFNIPYDDFSNLFQTYMVWTKKTNNHYLKNLIIKISKNLRKNDLLEYISDIQEFSKHVS